MIKIMNSEYIKPTIVQFLRFLVIGVVSTIVNYASFYLMYKYLGVNYLLSYICGFLSGTVLGYGLNKVWTFGVEENSIHFILKYLLVYLISLGLGYLFLKALVEFVDMNPEIANVFTIGLTTMTNFIGAKIWVFKK